VWNLGIVAPWFLLPLDLGHGLLLADAGTEAAELLVKLGVK
jgi:hypothetical protein